MDDTSAGWCMLCAMCRHWSWMAYSWWVSQMGRSSQKCWLTSLFQYSHFYPFLTYCSKRQSQKGVSSVWKALADGTMPHWSLWWGIHDGSWFSTSDSHFEIFVSCTLDSEGYIYCLIQWYKEFKRGCFGVDNIERCAFGAIPQPERQDK